jgi:uncharacterized cysteine cluster protein YcgN (CxxCxxCC family)
MKNLCIKCPTPGICCYFDVVANEKRICIDNACAFLDDKTRKCVIYKQRYKNPHCLTIEQMIKGGTVPKWCLYVKDNPEYQARIDTRIYKYKIVEEPL